MNLNPQFNSLATIQPGVILGSQEWADAGLHAKSHSTGGHGAYGWRHTHRVDQAFVSNALSNYLSRPVYYSEEPDRMLQYYAGGRPVGWSPEDPWDLPDGSREYRTQNGTIAVTGIDLQHFAIEPIWAIVEGGIGLDARTAVGPIGAADAAHMIAKKLVSTVLGQAGQVVPEYIGGRTLFRVLDTFVRAYKFQAFENPRRDTQAFLAWIDSEALPHLEAAPGVHEVIGKGGGYCNIYQSISWMLTPVHELAEGFASVGIDSVARRFAAIRVRLSQYLLDIETVKGGDAKWGTLKVTEAMRNGDGNGNPLQTLIGAIDADDVGGMPYYRLWAVMAADICAHALNSPEAEAFRDRVQAKAMAQAAPADKVWLVDRNRDYL